MEVFGQLIKAQFENLTADPVGAGLVAGRIWYRTDEKLFKVYDGAVVQTFVDLNTAQTLANKILESPRIDDGAIFEQITTPANPSAGFQKVYPKPDGKFYSLDSSGNEAQLGSGSGGSKNFIVNGNADDTATSIFVPYQDSSGTRPADGTGGVTTGITTSISAVSPLDGTKSFLLTKDAANRQGGGWAIPFTVDPAYRAKSVKISLPYIVNSGTFVAGSPTTDSDIIWYIYDVTNSALIEPSNIKMFSNSATISDMFEATFQTSATGSSYRLIAHIASTSALAYEIKTDEVKVSPQVYVFGTPVTDWEPVIVTGTWVTNTTYSAFRKQIGDQYAYMVTVSTSGAPDATTLMLNLPSGDVIDTTKLTSAIALSTRLDGTTGALDVGSAGYNGAVYYNNTTSVAPLLENVSGTYPIAGTISNTVPFVFAAGDSVTVTFRVPIVGLSSSVKMSNDASTNDVATVMQRTSSQTGVNTNNSAVKINIDGAAYVNTVGAANAASNRVDVTTAGQYDVGGRITLQGANVIAGAEYRAVVYKNGVEIVRGQTHVGVAGTAAQLTANGTVKAVAGDYFELYIFGSGNNSASTLTVYGDNAEPAYTSLTVNKRSGTAAIAEGETVSASYVTNASQSIPDNTFTIINYDTKDFDYNGAVTTGASWRFTAQKSGLYLVSAGNKLAYNAVSQATGNVESYVFKNGSQYKILGGRSYDTNSNATGHASGSVLVRLLAGQYVDVRLRQQTGGSRTLSNDTGDNRIDIIRVGNY